jgi:hypothetical protein
MSPVPTDELERRLGSVLAERAATVTDAPTIDGRADVRRRVAQRARHRRAVRAVVVVVALALLAAGLGLARRGDGAKHDERVVSGVYTTVPPLPRLALPSHVGSTDLNWLWPGTQEVLTLRPAKTYLRLDVVLSDLPLATIRAGHVVGPVQSMPAVVQGHPAFSVTVRPCCEQFPALYWKPDAHHVAGLHLDWRPGDTLAEATQRTVTLADQLVTMDEDAWWHLVSRPTATVDFGPTGHTEKVPFAALTDVAVRLGFPDGRSIPLDFDSSAEVQLVLDVPGYPTGTFHLRTGLTPLGNSSIVKPSDPMAVRVRGTLGEYQPTQKGFGSIVWLDHGLAVRLSFGPAIVPQTAGTTSTVASHGRLPTEQAALAVANQLTTLSASEWQSLWLPSAVRTDVVVLPAVRATPCFDWACPLQFLGVPAPHTTTTTR